MGLNEKRPGEEDEAMGMTMTQKILAAHAGLAEVKAGQLIEAELDLVLGNDITSPVAINEMKKMNRQTVFDKDKIIGYFFIRFFANRKAFRGKMVDVNFQGRGIAKNMGRIMTDVALGAGFRLFATISKDNLSSLASSKAVNEIRIVAELDNNYIYIEYLSKICKFSN